MPNKNTLVEMYPLYDDFQHIENLCTYRLLVRTPHPSTLHLFADEKLTETVRWEDVGIRLTGPINEIWGKI